MIDLSLPHAEDLAEWMAAQGIQKLTVNRDKRTQDLKIEASMFTTVKVAVSVNTAA